MSAPREKILIILTSHSELGNTGNKTGYYLPELAHPYYVLKDKYELVFATPKGGESPLDPGSVEFSKDDPISQGFLTDSEAVRLVANTHRIDEFIGRESEFVAVLYPGGHGPVFDLYSDEKSQSIAAKVYEQGGVVAAVCHGPAALVNIKLSNGEYLVKGKKVTGFSNEEEKAIKLDKAVPYLLEDALNEKGAIVTNGDMWSNNVAVDQRLVTGQNPQSAASMAEAVLRLLAH